MGFLLVSCQTDELMPVRVDDEFLTWIAAEKPLKNTTFLSNKILELCGKLPIFWLKPANRQGCLFLLSTTLVRRDKEIVCVDVFVCLSVNKISQEPGDAA